MDGKLTVQQLLGMARGVSSGMKFLSEMNFVHRVSKIMCFNVKCVVSRIIPRLSLIGRKEKQTKLKNITEISNSSKHHRHLSCLRYTTVCEVLTL